METVVTVAAIVFAIIAGMVLIHRLNAQHAERIGAFRYGDALPGIGRRRRNRPRKADSGPPAADPARREDRQG